MGKRGVRTHAYQVTLTQFTYTPCCPVDLSSNSRLFTVCIWQHVHKLKLSVKQSALSAALTSPSSVRFRCPHKSRYGLVSLTATPANTKFAAPTITFNDLRVVLLGRFKPLDSHKSERELLIDWFRCSAPHFVHKVFLKSDLRPMHPTPTTSPVPIAGRVDRKSVV